MGNTSANRLYRRLKSRPVSLRLQLDDSPAIRTAIPLKPKGFSVTIKVSRAISMTPNTASTPRAHLRPGPRESFTKKENLLDADINEKYQRICLWWVLPTVLWEERLPFTTSPPLHFPFKNKKSPLTRLKIIQNLSLFCQAIVKNILLFSSEYS